MRWDAKIIADDFAVRLTGSPDAGHAWACLGRDPGWLRTVSVRGDDDAPGTAFVGPRSTRIGRCIGGCRWSSTGVGAVAVRPVDARESCPGVCRCACWRGCVVFVGDELVGVGGVAGRGHVFVLVELGGACWG